ncbi:hypothetical protein ACFFOU_24760 [Pseudonocardia sulfidoxydans]|uniref:hypothetical protein n=1 Tax=Pseudonocardia sulfidoxydans TaxID=54011 RepID=UPI0011BFB17F|nr:hypothetical protein [Pseudonocardia sulfidoxydans]
MADDEIAQPVPCVRCRRDALLNMAGHCSDCIADMGLNHVEEHGTWRAELAELVKSGELAGA